jgi:hypothetical protein
MLIVIAEMWNQKEEEQKEEAQGRSKINGAGRLVHGGRGCPIFIKAISLCASISVIPTNRRC